MSTQERPLSPHLQIYRPQLTSVLSISHRATGIILSIGLIPLIAWVVALGSGAESFSQLNALYAHPVLALAWVVWSFCLFYHLLNGLRHLMWDAGYWLDIRGAYASGWTVVTLAFVLTALAWGWWS